MDYSFPKLGSEKVAGVGRAVAMLAVVRQTFQELLEARVGHSILKSSLDPQ
jgi:hypothetical protein